MGVFFCSGAEHQEQPALPVRGAPCAHFFRASSFQGGSLPLGPFGGFERVQFTPRSVFFEANLYVNSSIILKTALPKQNIYIMQSTLPTTIYVQNLSFFVSEI